MKIVILVLFLLTNNFLLAKRIHVSALDLNHKEILTIPDLAGYIFTKDNFANNENEHSLFSNESDFRNLPQVYAGFPVSFNNSNTHNGAVYFNMDDDPDMEILFGVGTKIVALKLDGSPVPGWPVNLNYFIWGSPAIGDITGDGNYEVVATSRNNTTGNIGELYAFHLDGTLVDGFPVTQSGGGTLNACLADITGDGVLEILVNVRNHPNGWVYVYNGSGEVVDGWPQALDTFPGAAISSGDLNNNGQNEVVALSYESLFVFDNQGNLMDGFPFAVTGVTYSYSSPVLVDLDGDGNREIVFGGCTSAGGQVFVVNHDGTLRNGWPQSTGNWVFATVSIGDINGNGELNIVVGDQVASSEPANYIYAWDLEGNSLTGFPAGPTNAIYTQIGIVDITGDDNVNLVIDSNLFGHGYDCYNHDGTHNASWPLPCGTDWSSTTMQSTPVFGDFNGNGYLDMAGAATALMSWVVEIYLWSTDVEYNEDLAFMIIDSCNIRHDGVYNQEISTIFQPPVNLTAEAGDGFVNLSWQMPVRKRPIEKTNKSQKYLNDINGLVSINDNKDIFDSKNTYNSSRQLIGFNIYRDDILLNAVLVEELFYSDKEVINGKTYSYFVTAVYTEGESVPSNTVTATPEGEGILVPPYNLTAKIIDINNVLLEWETDYLGWVRLPLGYNIYRNNQFIAQTDLSELTYFDNDLPDGKYEYFVTTYSEESESEPSNTVKVEFVYTEEALINDALITLEKNYPNPFNPYTTIKFYLPENDFVLVEIFNLNGQKIKTLTNDLYNAGRHKILWNGKDDSNNSQSSGIYFYRMTVGDFVSAKKMILLK